MRAPAPWPCSVIAIWQVHPRSESCSRGLGVKGRRVRGTRGLHPRAWTSEGVVRARPRPARPCRGQRALPGGSRGSGSSSSFRSSPGLSRARRCRRTEIARAARPSGAGHGRSFVRCGARGGRPGPRELRAAAPDSAAGRVLGEWPLSWYLTPQSLASLIPPPDPHPPPIPRGPLSRRPQVRMTSPGWARPPAGGGGAGGDSLGP